MVNFKSFINSPNAFIVAEVGQNHQGDLATAIEYINKFSYLGANAVKFQCRDNRFLFDSTAYNKKYNSENAFASTYGEHREFLELTKDELIDIKNTCLENDVSFVVTPFDEPSLDLVTDIGVDILKVASFDLGNLPFIAKMAATKLPIIMSVGGGKIEHIQDSVEAILNYHDNLAVLHCVSEYPTPIEHLGLENIGLLRDLLPDVCIGLSDHFNGIVTGPIGFTYGARVFEKHVTLDRTLKGTDHSFALEPDGFRRFVRDIRRVPLMMKSKPEADLGSEPVFVRLGKSLVAGVDLQSGDTLNLENLSGKIFDTNIVPVREARKFIGKKILRTIRAGEAILFSDIIGD